jgi:hypothetical protein
MAAHAGSRVPAPVNRGAEEPAGQNSAYQPHAQLRGPSDIRGPAAFLADPFPP